MMMNRGELDGVRVLKPETVDLMFQDHLAVNATKYGQRNTALAARSMAKVAIRGAVPGGA
ncbi:MAG: hypothetical protein R3C49_21785 [Planctomycetaceae bacterium]